MNVTSVRPLNQMAQEGDQEVRTWVRKAQLVMSTWDSQPLSGREVGMEM